MTKVGTHRMSDFHLSPGRSRKIVGREDAGHAGPVDSRCRCCLAQVRVGHLGCTRPSHGPQPDPQGSATLCKPAFSSTGPHAGTEAWGSLVVCIGGAKAGALGQEGHLESQFTLPSWGHPKLRRCPGDLVKPRPLPRPTTAGPKGVFRLGLRTPPRPALTEPSCVAEDAEQGGEGRACP